MSSGLPPLVPSSSATKQALPPPPKSWRQNRRHHLPKWHHHQQLIRQQQAKLQSRSVDDVRKSGASPVSMVIPRTPSSRRLQMLIHRNEYITDLVSQLKARIRLRNAVSMSNLATIHLDYLPTIPASPAVHRVTTRHDSSSSSESSENQNHLRRRTLPTGRCVSPPPSVPTSALKKAAELDVDSGAASDEHFSDQDKPLEKQLNIPQQTDHHHHHHHHHGSFCSLESGGSASTTSFCRVHTCRILSILAHCSQVVQSKKLDAPIQIPVVREENHRHHLSPPTTWSPSSTLSSWSSTSPVPLPSQPALLRSPSYRHATSSTTSPYQQKPSTPIVAAASPRQPTPPTQTPVIFVPEFSFFC